MEAKQAKPPIGFFFLGFLIGFIIFYQIFPPFKMRVKGLVGVVYQFEAMMVLDFESARVLHYLNLLAFRDTRRIAGNSVFFKQWLDAHDYCVNRVKKRLFFVFSPVLVFLVFYLKKAGKIEKPYYQRKFDLREYIERKYKIRIPSKLTPEIAYRILDKVRKKKNFPINLMARFFPSLSRERAYLYAGGKEGFRFVVKGDIRTNETDVQL